MAARRPVAGRTGRRLGGEDTEAIVALYAVDVVFSTQPFRTPHLRRAGVREYVSQAFAEEDEPRVWVGDPVVDGDRAAIEWWAAADRERRRDDAGGDIGPAL